MFTHAITRTPGANFDLGITTASLGRPSYALILEQHKAYINTLAQLGLQVINLDPELDYPDAYFVEDPAIVTPRVAVITRLGAPSRRGEQLTLEPVLARYRPVVCMPEPGTLDGGDVLMVGNHFYVGISHRTNKAGAGWFGEVLVQYGHTWEAVPVQAGLHLKSSVSLVAEDVLLMAPVLQNHPAFAQFHKILLDPEESYAANTLWLNQSLVTPGSYPKAREQLSRLGMPVIELDVSEVQKMDGGLTCMSLRFTA